MLWSSHRQIHLMPINFVFCVEEPLQPLSPAVVRCDMSLVRRDAGDVLHVSLGFTYCKRV